MSDLIALGSAGIRAYSAGLATISDNIANAQTPGFARRSVMLAENAPHRPSPLLRNDLQPGGSRVVGIARAVDRWAQDEARLASGESGLASANARWLAVTETALGDPASDVGAAITGLFNIADQLAADPGNATRRAEFVLSVDAIAKSFNRTGEGLSRALQGAGDEARATVSGFNADLAELQSINASLARAREGSTPQASLLDRRDAVIDRMAATLDIGVEFDARGAAKVSLAGSGALLLEGNVRNDLAVAVGGDGRLTYSANPGVAFAPSQGALAGLARATDHIASQITALDTIATDFANRANAAHATGTDAQGNPGANLFSTSAGTATGLRAAISDGTGVAAADASGPNGNMLAFASLRDGSGGEAQWRAFAGTQSAAVAQARAFDEAAGQRASIASVMNADISAVDLDREAADLLRFQQAYQGAARVLQTAREIMQSILAI